MDSMGNKNHHHPSMIPKTGYGPLDCHEFDVSFRMFFTVSSLFFSKDVPRQFTRCSYQTLELCDVFIDFMVVFSNKHQAKTIGKTHN